MVIDGMDFSNLTHHPRGITVNFYLSHGLALRPKSVWALGIFSIQELNGLK